MFWVKKMQNVLFSYHNNFDNFIVKHSSTPKTFKTEPKPTIKNPAFLARAIYHHQNNSNLKAKFN